MIESELKYYAFIFLIIALIIILVHVFQSGPKELVQATRLYCLRSKTTGLYLDGGNVLAVSGIGEYNSTIWYFLTYTTSNNAMVLQNSASGRYIGFADGEVFMTNNINDATLLIFTYRSLSMCTIGVNAPDFLFFTAVGTSLELEGNDIADNHLFEIITV